MLIWLTLFLGNVCCVVYVHVCLDLLILLHFFIFLMCISLPIIS